MTIIKALADENRVRILCCLREQTLCVCQITELLGLAPSTVSKHLSILHHARLVVSRKQGRWVYYKLAGPEAPAVVQQGVEWVLESLEGNPQILKDIETMNKIQTLDPEVLCRTQAGR